MERRDRRMERTRTAIFEAFWELLQQEDFEKISISDITERANINRSTFYLHYTDKYDLLQQTIRGRLDQIDPVIEGFSGANNPDETRPHIRAIVDHFDTNRGFYALILQKSSAQYCHALLQEKLSVWAGAEIENQQLPPDQREFNLHLVVFAMDGLLSWWVLDPDPMSSEQLAENILETFQRLHRPV